MFMSLIGDNALPFIIGVCVVWIAVGAIEVSDHGVLFKVYERIFPNKKSVARAIVVISLVIHLVVFGVTSIMEYCHADSWYKEEMSTKQKVVSSVSSYDYTETIRQKNRKWKSSSEPSVPLKYVDFGTPRFIAIGGFLLSIPCMALGFIFKWEVIDRLRGEHDGDHQKSNLWDDMSNTYNEFQADLEWMAEELCPFYNKLIDAHFKGVYNGDYCLARVIVGASKGGVLINAMQFGFEDPGITNRLVQNGKIMDVDQIEKYKLYIDYLSVLEGLYIKSGSSKRIYFESTDDRYKGLRCNLKDALKFLVVTGGKFVIDEALPEGTTLPSSPEESKYAGKFEYTRDPYGKSQLIKKKMKDVETQKQMSDIPHLNKAEAELFRFKKRVIDLEMERTFRQQYRDNREDVVERCKKLYRDVEKFEDIVLFEAQQSMEIYVRLLMAEQGKILAGDLCRGGCWMSFFYHAFNPDPKYLPDPDQEGFRMCMNYARAVERLLRKSGTNENLLVHFAHFAVPKRAFSIEDTSKVLRNFSYTIDGGDGAGCIFSYEPYIRAEYPEAEVIL